MTEREALLQAVILEPGDLTHRRIFADWLLEYGDQRDQEYGAFIHGQLDGRHGFVQTSHWPAQSHAMWAGEPFNRLPWDSARWEWRGGFIEVLDCTTLDFLHHARELFACQPIREVRLRDREPFDGPGLMRSWKVWTGSWAGEAPYAIPEGVYLAYVVHALRNRQPRPREESDPVSHNARILPFESEAVARLWLSRSCVLYGRQLAGLTGAASAPLAGSG